MCGLCGAGGPGAASAGAVARKLATDAEKTAEIFDILLGDNLQGRKDYIVAHGNEYIDNLDVS